VLRCKLTMTMTQQHLAIVYTQDFHHRCLHRCRHRRWIMSMSMMYDCMLLIGIFFRMILADSTRLTRHDFSFAKIPRQKIFHVSALFFYVIGPRHLAFIVQYLVHSS
jgi:hypothetical protein